MRIVTQSATASYSQFPAQLLMLPAPSIAGLLPATVPSSRPQTTTLSLHGRVFRSFADWEAADAELEAYFARARSRLAALMAEDAAHRLYKSTELVVCHA